MLAVLNLVTSLICLMPVLGVGLLSLNLASRVLRTSILPALPMAFAVLVSFETVLVNLLGLFHGVTRIGMATAHALALALVWLIDARKGRSSWSGFSDITLAAKAVVRRPEIKFLAPLLLTLLFVALLYPPNNWDSMSYHLARVVHWIEQGSVAFFPTSHPAENDTQPGAEYLLLVLQLATQSDRLANCVQFTAFALLLTGVGTLTRYLRAPRALQTPLVLLFGTAPAFVLQATSTQNDLCAAVATLAVLSAIRRPLFSARLSFDARDGWAIGCALACAYIVKPTALLWSLPFLVYAAVRSLRALFARTDQVRKLVTATVIALSIGVAVCAPHLYRKAFQGGWVGATEAELTFPLTSGWLAARRIANPVLVLAHHVPWSTPVSWLRRLYTYCAELDPPLPAREGFDRFYSGQALRQYEDLAGAPVQLLATGVFYLLAFFAGGLRSRRRARLLVALHLSSWVGFHLIARNTAWLARYHAPWLTLAVLSAGCAVGLARTHRRARSAIVATTWCFALLSTAYAWSTAIANEMRPVTSSALSTFDRSAASYRLDLTLEAQQKKILEIARGRSCSSLALMLGEQGLMEYQLTWAARQQGMRVAHSPGPADACLIYAPNGWRPEVAPTGKSWKVLHSEPPLLYVPGIPAETDPLRWTASSGDWGFSATGALGVHGAHGLLFHTREEEQPWFLLDLSKRRELSQIVVTNRRDCCRDRGLPLVAELSDDGISFRSVGRQGEVFDTWEVRFPPTRARYLRLRSESRTVLHLQNVGLSEGQGPAETSPPDKTP